jgi:hypothetical protein
MSETDVYRQRAAKYQRQAAAMASPTLDEMCWDARLEGIDAKTVVEVLRHRT